MPVETVKIELRKETVRRIASFGLKGEAYDTIINRLLDQIVLLRELRSPDIGPRRNHTVP